MTTVGELIENFRDTVQQKDETASHFSNAEIMHWFSFAQRSICLNAELLVRTHEIPSIAEQNSYSLPDGFAKIYRARYIGGTRHADILNTTTRNHLDITNPGWVRGASLGTPKTYFIEGDKIFLYPTPNEGGNIIELVYMAIPEKLTALNQVPEIPEVLTEGLVAYALYRGYNKVKQPQAGRDYLAEYKQVLLMARGLANDRNAQFISKMKDVSSSAITFGRTPGMIVTDWG